MNLGLIELILILTIFLSLGLWIWAIVDVSCHKFPGNRQLVWIIVVVLTGIVGTLAYFAVGRKERILA